MIYIIYIIYIIYKLLYIEELPNLKGVYLNDVRV